MRSRRCARNRAVPWCYLAAAGSSHFRAARWPGAGPAAAPGSAAGGTAVSPGRHRDGQPSGNARRRPSCTSLPVALFCPQRLLPSRRRVALSYGLGADSTAVLLRWLAEPAVRPCDLADLIVVTAMTGDEWKATGQLVEAHVLPRLRASGVRYAQVARLGPHQADGVALLDDSRSPTRLRLAGAWRLSDELLAAGTVPQVAGPRKCSVKAKGWVIDQFLAMATAGAPFLHAMGYESGEAARARRDAAFNTRQRTGIYPLVDWDWDRAACEDYILALTGVQWPKSACTYCPFGLATPGGRARVLAAYLAEPDTCIRDLVIEHIAVTLNPRQSLTGHGTLASLLASTGQHDEILAGFARELATIPWQVQEVRRAIRPWPGDLTRPGQAARSLRTLAAGCREAMAGRLAALAASAGIPLVAGTDGITRAWLRRRADRYPCAEHFLASVPAGPQSKDGPGFSAAWLAASAAVPAGPGIAGDMA